MKVLTLLSLVLVACSAADPGVEGLSRGGGSSGGSSSGSSSGAHGGSGSGSGSGSSSGSGSGSGSGGGSVPTDAGSGSGGDSGLAGGEGGALQAYGKACATSADCTDAVYNACQQIQQALICTKACTVAADCPAPPTGGTCNANGFCK